MQVYESLASKGFPIWMDTHKDGAAGRDGLADAGLFVAFLTKEYNDVAHAHDEYTSALGMGECASALQKTCASTRGVYACKQRPRS